MEITDLETGCSGLGLPDRAKKFLQGSENIGWRFRMYNLLMAAAQQLAFSFCIKDPINTDFESLLMIVPTSFMKVLDMVGEPLLWKYWAFHFIFRNRIP